MQKQSAKLLELARTLHFYQQTFEAMIMNKILSTSSAIALFGTALLTPNVAVADSNQARLYLEGAAYDELPDYDFTGRPYAGSIAAGQVAYRTVRLQAGIEYAFLAACDNDCSDVDLYLYDRSGQTLFDSDTGLDDYPLITYIPSTTGNYRLQVQMYTCSNSSCGYALGTLVR